MKFKARLVLVAAVLLAVVFYSLKRRFFRRRSVALDKYLADNKDRRHILDSNIDAEELDRFNDNASHDNCNSSGLTWTGLNYDMPKIILEPIYDDYTSVRTVFFTYCNVSNRDSRNLIRNTYGQKTIREKYIYKVVFVLGGFTGSDSIHRDFAKSQLEKEQLAYNDMLVLDIDDSLENNAIKGLAVLKWILQCVKSVINIIKIEMNTVPNIPLLFNDLNSRSVAETHKELFCAVETGQMIEDKNKNISIEGSNAHERTPPKIFPAHCNGAFIVFSKYVLQRLLKAADRMPVFKIEDVYFTGLLREYMCIPVPHRRMRIPKIVETRTYNIGAYHFIAFNTFNGSIFRNTWESALVFEKLTGLL